MTRGAVAPLDVGVRDDTSADRIQGFLNNVPQNNQPEARISSASGISIRSGADPQNLYSTRDSENREGVVRDTSFSSYSQRSSVASNYEGQMLNDPATSEYPGSSAS